MPELFPQYQMVNMNVKYTAEQAKYIAETMVPHVDFGVHPKGIFFMVLRNVPRAPNWWEAASNTITDCMASDETDYSKWIFHIALTFPTNFPGAPLKDQSNAERVGALRSLADDMSEPRRSVLKWLPEGQEVPYDPIKVWEPTQWDGHGGRVTLAGDAAHSISFRACFRVQNSYKRLTLL